MNSSAVHVALCRMSVLGAAPADEESRALRATFSFRDHHRLNGSSQSASLSVHQNSTIPSTESACQAAPTTAAASSSSTAAPAVKPNQTASPVSLPSSIKAPASVADSQPVTMPLPSCTKLLDNQIAGHRHGAGKHKLGVLRHKDGSVLKPLVPDDDRAEREHDFYLVIERHRGMCSRENCDDPILHELVDFTPRYLGIFDGEFEEGRRIPYMKLEDLCQGFLQPCIADIKIGRIIHNPLASKEKIEFSKKRYPPQFTIGYRLLGMRVFEEGQCQVYNAEFGLEQTEKSVPNAIKTFVAANVACVPQIVEKLRKILSWFKRQTRFTFYSSSILFVYDAAQLKTSVKLIDFAHVFPTTTVDDNYIYGLERLLDHFCQAAEKV